MIRFGVWLEFHEPDKQRPHSTHTPSAYTLW
jgi:hypothetical protein